MEYHIGNCKGPCEGLQPEEDYMEDIKQVRSILKGNLSIPKGYFKEQMEAYAAAFAFEKADYFKRKLDLLDRFQNKSIVVNPRLTEMDILTCNEDEKKAYLNFMKIQHGTIVASKNLEVKKSLNESAADILSYVALEIRQETGSRAREILTNIEFEYPEDSVITTVPQIGDKKKLVSLSYKNATQFKIERGTKRDKTSQNRILETLQEDLRLKDLPTHIECFDNSNIQGSNPVASMVCFRMGKPAKRDYRHFKIKTVEGPDDFGSMREIVYRRYARLIRENKELPKLIIIDGGKGQLSAAAESLKSLGVYEKIPIVGIAKRLEEIYYPEDSDPLFISKKSESLKLIQHLRNEAHRFAITFHRDQRSKDFTTSSLDTISGIGPKTRDELFRHFGSLKRIKEASEPELAKIVGPSKAKMLVEKFEGL
jgi:excinuclease ABC subunit C